MDNKNKKMKQFFDISVAAFGMQYSISKAFGYTGEKSKMHLLHISAKEELEKDNPNHQVMYILLSQMEAEAEYNFSLSKIREYLKESEKTKEK